MYEYLNGILTEKLPEATIIDVSRIGYRCKTPLSTFSELPEVGKKVKLYISFIVREDSQTLYGFYSKHERDLFQLINTVSGIGPKTALALVGHLGLPAFNTAIQNDSINTISKVPGIGKKTATRLIVEMKDKLGFLEKMKTDADLDDVDTLSLDAINALINLGYHPNQAKKAVQKVRLNHERLNTLIPSALQHI